jgi:hypothetical protein
MENSKPAVTTEQLTALFHRVKSRELTQTQAALSVGMSPPAFMSRLKTLGLAEQLRIGRGGIPPSTTPEMVRALAEAISPRANIAEVARAHGVPYVALFKRVQNLRNKEAKALAEAARLAMKKIADDYDNEHQQALPSGNRAPLQYNAPDKGKFRLNRTA